MLVCFLYYGSSLKRKPRACNERVTADESGLWKIGAVLTFTSVSLEGTGMMVRQTWREGPGKRGKAGCRERERGGS